MIECGKSACFALKRENKRFPQGIFSTVRAEKRFIINTNFTKT